MKSRALRQDLSFWRQIAAYQVRSGMGSGFDILALIGSGVLTR
jgi:hypothetical protein